MVDCGGIVWIVEDKIYRTGKPLGQPPIDSWEEMNKIKENFLLAKYV